MSAPSRERHATKDEWDSRALLSLFLVDLPELEDWLSQSTHKSLLSRLHTRLRLEPVTANDSASSLRHRLHPTRSLTPPSTRLRGNTRDAGQVLEERKAPARREPRPMDCGG